MVTPHPTGSGEDDSSAGARILHRFRTVGAAFALFVTLVGGVHLAAWLTGVMANREVSPITMQTNSALSLLALGVAVLLVLTPDVGAMRRWFAASCAALATLVGVLTLSQHITGWNLGIDELLAQRPPGAVGVFFPNRPGPPASVGFILAGSALLLLSLRSTCGSKITHGLALGVSLVGLVGTVGYLYETEAFYGLTRVTAVAWPTAVCLLLLGMALLCIRPETGIMAQISANDAGGAIIRRLVLPVIFLPTVVGWLRLIGGRMGLFTATVGTALVILVSIVVFSCLVYQAGRRLSQTAMAERQARRSADEQARRLHRTLESMAEGYIVLDRNWRVLDLNRTAECMLSRQRDTLLGRNIWDEFPGARELRFGRETKQLLMRGGEVHFEEYYPPLDIWLAVDGYAADAEMVYFLRDTTQRKRAEEALRESEEKYRTVADHTYAWEFWIGPDGRFLYNSPSCKTVTGYEADAFLADATLFDRLIHPDDRGLYAAHRGPGVQACTTNEVEFRIVCADGNIRWLAHSCVPVHGRHGEFLGVRGSNRDVTASKAARAAIQEAEERWAAFMRYSPGAAWIKDAQGRYVYSNPEAERIYGVPLEQLRGLTDEDLFPPETARQLRENDCRVLAEGRALQTVEEIRSKNGTVKHLLVSKFVLHGPSGGPPGTAGVAFDITDRVQVEDALRKSETFWRQMLESIPGMVFTTRPDGYCDYQSHQWVEFTGVPMSEHLGEGWNTLLHPDDRPRALAAWRAAVAGAAPYDLEYRVRRRDGQYEWFKVIGRPIRDEDGNIIRWFGTALNIEALKRTEQALNAARNSAERAKAAAEEASAAKDRFLAMLSHELRTPLTPVLAAVSMLQRNPLLEDQTRDGLEMIRRNVELEARLIDDLLDLTRIARGKIELNRQPVDLSTVIHRAVEVCRPDIEARQLHFDVEIGPDAPYLVEADVARLQQVFWNLLKNSIKFTPHGGCVGICCRLDGHDAAIVEVRDSGIGIEPDALARIFDAFAQEHPAANRQFGGLGLGLAISRSLVELHGGTIHASSPGKGQGAIFAVRLPLLAAQADGVPVTAAAAPPLRLQRPLRLLVVEDHGDTAQMMRLMLESEGHEVETAGDVATAIEAVGRSTFDMLISDLGLPDGSGIDLMRELRNRGSRLPGIAVSGFGQGSDIQQARDVGFAAHITKPVDMDRLLSIITGILANRAA